jgi:hypothetical protein
MHVIRSLKGVIYMVKTIKMVNICLTEEYLRINLVKQITFVAVMLVC